MTYSLRSDSNPAALRVLNVLSLLAGGCLLVAVSWEILAGNPRHYSTNYLLLQGVVCVVFLADFVARMVLAEHSWRFFVHNLYFLLLSVPYLNIVDWTGVALSHEEAMLMGLVPLLRALLGLYVLFSWIIENKVTRLLTTYVLSLSVFTYFAALVFYDYEVRINPAVRDFGDAVWWACMNLTTVGSDIVAVTVIGKVLTVLLPTMGMLMFPIFTVYVTQLYTRNRSEERDKP
ncbi:MAG: potassium channel family protein [Alistipes sp.]|nr:potassium channel family protein [Alistipes sp.]